VIDVILLRHAYAKGIGDVPQNPPSPSAAGGKAYGFSLLATVTDTVSESVETDIRRLELNLKKAVRSYAVPGIHLVQRYGRTAYFRFIFIFPCVVWYHFHTELTVLHS